MWVKALFECDTSYKSKSISTRLSQSSHSCRVESAGATKVEMLYSVFLHGESCQGRV